MSSSSIVSQTPYWSIRFKCVPTAPWRPETCVRSTLKVREPVHHDRTLFVEKCLQPSHHRLSSRSDIDQLITISGMVIRTSQLIPEMQEAFFRCQVCAFNTRVEVDRGRIAEPAVCRNCNTTHSMALVHNRSAFSDKQMVGFLFIYYFIFIFIIRIYLFVCFCFFCIIIFVKMIFLIYWIVLLRLFTSAFYPNKKWFCCMCLVLPDKAAGISRGYACGSDATHHSPLCTQWPGWQSAAWRPSEHHWYDLWSLKLYVVWYHI